MEPMLAAGLRAQADPSRAAQELAFIVERARLYLAACAARLDPSSPGMQSLRAGIEAVEDRCDLEAALARLPDLMLLRYLEILGGDGGQPPQGNGVPRRPAPFTGSGVAGHPLPDR